MLLLAEYSTAFLVFLIFAVILAVIMRNSVTGVGPTLWFLFRTAAIAIALLPEVNAANRASTTFVVGAAALPAMYLCSDPTKQIRTKLIPELVLSLLALTAWSYIVWHYSWLPAYGVLALAIIWRFGFSATELNEDDAETVRRSAGFAGLALLGLGMLLLDHGALTGLFDSNQFANISDRIAVTVVAPLWLVHNVIARAPRRIGHGVAESFPLRSHNSAVRK
jgi:hypothetical protein